MQTRKDFWSAHPSHPKSCGGGEPDHGTHRLSFRGTESHGGSHYGGHGVHAGGGHHGPGRGGAGSGGFDGPTGPPT